MIPSVIRYFVEVGSGSLFIFVLIAVNIIGYGIGIVGFGQVFRQLTSLEGLLVLATCNYVLFWGVMFMFYLRRRGWTS